MEFPSIVGVGGAKCGTTWLNECFGQSPRTFTVPAEVNFYSSKWQNGVDWYGGLYAGKSATQIGIDISPSYFVSEEAPTRIMETNSSARLFLIARDPVKRLYSQYCMLMRGGAATDDLENEVFRKGRLIEEGRYASCIERYEQVLGHGTVKVFLFDDLVSDPVQFWISVCEWIHVSPYPIPSLVKTKLHVARNRPKSVRLQQLGARAVAKIGRIPRVGRAATKWIRQGPASKLFHRLNQGACYPSLTDEQRQRLIEIYRSDVQWLSDRLGRDLVREWLDK